MLENAIRSLREQRFRLRNRILKARLKNKDFTIISNNCWGEYVYRDLNIPYLTPFVNMHIFSPCYISMLKNLRNSLGEGRIDFIDVSQSRYIELIKELESRDKRSYSYPIGLLNGNIEVHFIHYSTAEEAREKWIRRVKRINWDNLFIKFDDWDDMGEYLDEFDKISLKHKVCFTRKEYPHLKSSVYLESFRNKGRLFHAPDLYRISHMYFDIIGWLNGENARINFIQKAVKRMLYFKVKDFLG